MTLFFSTRLFDGDGPYTVFVPTNRAWYAMLVNLGVTKEDLFEDPSLTEVLLHHATRREIFSQQMFFGQKIPTLHMSAPSVSRALRAAVNAGMDPSSASVALTETLEVETFTNIIRKAFFVNGCDVLTKDKQASSTYFPTQIPHTVCPYKTDTFFYLSQTV